jgi:hypothetical protein
MVLLTVTDSRGTSAQETVTVNAPLSLPAGSITIGGNTSYSLVPTGGQGPYTYSIVSGSGTVDAGGHYTAPAAASTDIVQVADALGSIVRLNITVNPPLTMFPASATLTAGSGQSLAFAGQGGVPPYRYVLLSGTGTVGAQGLYTVGNTSGVEPVQVTDSQGTAVQAPVHVLRIRVNGAVFAMATDGSSLYVAGLFSAVNPASAPRLALVDAQSGALALSCDLGSGFLDGSVTAVVTLGNAIYVAGSFNHYRGAIVGKLAKIDATTCALDTTFTAAGGFGLQIGESVTALLSVGTSLYVAGNVSSYRGAPIAGLVKLDPTSGVADPTFQPPASDGVVAALAASDSSVYAGGYFTHYGGVASSYVAKLDAKSGAVDTTFAQAPGADAPVTTLALLGSALYLSGAFQHYAGLSSGLAKADATSGAVDAAFTQQVANHGDIAAIAASGSSLYIGERFPKSGVPILAKIDATTGITDPTFTLSSGFDLGVWALTVTGTSVYAGGVFTSYRSLPAYCLAKLDAATGALDMTFTQSTGGNGPVRALASTGSIIVAGGELTTYRGQPANNLVKFDLATDAVDANFVMQQLNSSVTALALSGPTLYLGGYFTSYGGVNAPWLAKLDAASGALDFTFAPQASFPVNALLLSGTTLYAGGGGAGTAQAYLAKLNSSTGAADPTFAAAATPDGNVNALAMSGSALYVGGQFQHYGGTPAQNLVKVDPTSGALDVTFTQTSGAGGATEWIDAIALAGGSVYAGGNIAHYRGSAIQGLIKVDAATGVLDTSFTQTLGLWGRGEALAPYGTSLFVAGNSNQYRAIASTNLIELDQSSGAPVSAFAYAGSCDSCAANFRALNVINGRLYVGADAATLYRGVPTYFSFPVDLTTGKPSDP